MTRRLPPPLKRLGSGNALALTAEILSGFASSAAPPPVPTASSTRPLVVAGLVLEVRSAVVNLVVTGLRSNDGTANDT